MFKSTPLSTVNLPALNDFDRTGCPVIVRCLSYLRHVILVLLVFIVLARIPCTSPHAAEKDKENHSTGFVIVLWNGCDSERQDELLDSLPMPCSVLERDSEYMLCSFPSLQMELAITLLNDLPEVVIAEPDSYITLKAISDDTFSDSQWTLDNSGSYVHISEQSSDIAYTVPDIDIDMPEAWALYEEAVSEKHQVTVAVIDTGVDYNHQDLKGHIWTNNDEIPDDGIDNDGNGYTDDVNGWDFYNNDSSICHYSYDSATGSYLASPKDSDDHGTHCAGIITATKDNQEGIAGIASNTDLLLMSLKIHGGPNRKGTVSNAIQAIKYADRMGADICNMSWGSYIYSEVLYLTIKESPMLFIAAAGNDGTDNDAVPLYPACYDLPNVISVAFTDSSGNLAELSNYGLNSVNLAVPAVDVYSTTVGSYSSMSGSSMAAAHLTGIAALLYSSGQGVYASDIRDILLGSVKRLAPLEGLVKSQGISSAFLAVSSIPYLRHDTQPASLSIERSFVDDQIKLSFSCDDGDGAGFLKLRYFIGKKSVEDFAHGTQGTRVDNFELLLPKSGLYTFYLSDAASNETAYQYLVVDDSTSPEIDLSYSVSFDYSRITINAVASDAASGIKLLKYLPGKKARSDFASVPNKDSLMLSKDGGARVIVRSPGEYSFLAIDNRGNKKLEVLDVNIIQAESVTLSRKSKSLKVGNTYQLEPVLSPLESTDKIKYSSSNSKIAKVSKTGLVTALAKGKTKITAKAASGKKALITIRVR